MRAAVADRRLICPTANQWALTGGAYRDGDEIVLPSSGAWATLWVPVTGVARLTAWPLVLVQDATGTSRRQLQHHGYDAGRGNLMYTYASGGTIQPLGEWARAESPAPAFPSGIHWLRLRIAAGSHAVGPVRFRPGGPDDWTITH